MPYLTSVKRDGSEWIPEFVKEIKKSECIACGRCFKVCAHNVLNLKEYEDDEFDDIKPHMTVESENDCIGCKSCSRTCPRNCFIHSPIEV